MNKTNKVLIGVVILLSITVTALAVQGAATQSKIKNLEEQSEILEINIRNLIDFANKLSENDAKLQEQIDGTQYYYESESEIEDGNAASQDF